MKMSTAEENMHSANTATISQKQPFYYNQKTPQNTQKTYQKYINMLGCDNQFWRVFKGLFQKQANIAGGQNLENTRHFQKNPQKINAFTNHKW